MTKPKRLKLFSAAIYCVAAASMSSGATAGSAAYEDKIAAAKSSMMGNTAAALSFARDARDLVEKSDPEADRDALTASWLEAEALLRLNRADEAKEIAKATLLQVQNLLPGTKLHANLLRSNGSMAAVASEYEDALDYFSEARELFNQLGEKRSEAIVLQNIGSIYNDARDYARVLHYYDLAANVYSGDDALALSGHNNKGNAYKELGRYQQAQAEFEGALEIAEKFGSPMLSARILTNLASTQHLGGQYAEAESTAQTALGIAKENAPDWSPFIYGVLAQIEFARGDLDLAEHYITVTFANQSLEQTNALFRDFHESAADIFAARQKRELAERHHAAFQRIESKATSILKPSKDASN